MKDLVDAGLVADCPISGRSTSTPALYNASLASAYTFDGKIYGMPDIVAYWVVFYNKKVFERAGSDAAEDLGRARDDQRPR